MKINDLSNNISKIGNFETAANKQKEEDNNTNKATLNILQPSERVDLSNASVDFSNAAEKMEEAPVERAEKIQSLRMKVQSGDYNVDSTKVAEKIINDTLFNDSKR
jgi:flagellar biosynthesis anti-sigma factor FlgM